MFILLRAYKRSILIKLTTWVLLIILRVQRHINRNLIYLSSPPSEPPHFPNGFGNKGALKTWLPSADPMFSERRSGLATALALPLRLRLPPVTTDQPSSSTGWRRGENLPCEERERDRERTRRTPRSAVIRGWRRLEIFSGVFSSVDDGVFMIDLAYSWHQNQTCSKLIDRLTKSR